MNGARRVAVPAGIAGWAYGWFLLRGVRSEYGPPLGGPLGGAPAGLLVLLLLLTFVCIATAIVAGMRLRAWPVMAIASGVFLLAGVLAAQYVPLRDYAASQGAGPVGLGEVVTVALRNRSPAGVVVTTAIPTLLVLSGMSGVILRAVP
ncbi:MAG: hypothetical protein ACRDKW_03465, partial [Actinomycetota bacterium]